MRLILALLLPWLQFFTIGRPFAGLVCLLLQVTIIGWIPAAIWSVYALSQYKTDRKIAASRGSNSGRKKAPVPFGTEAFFMAETEVLATDIAQFDALIEADLDGFEGHALGLGDEEQHHENEQRIQSGIEPEGVGRS